MSKILLSVNRILDYFDYPQLILCEDAVQSFYLSMLYELENDCLKYFSTRISSKKLHLLLENKIDVLSIFNNPEIPTYFEFSISPSSDSAFEAVETDYDFISKFFPEPSLFIGHSDGCDELVRMAIETNRVLYELHICEDNNKSSVSANILIDYLSLAQKLFKHGFTKAIKNVSEKVRERILNNKSSTLNVFAFARGSLKIHFNSNSYVDCYGYSDDDILLALFNNLFTLDLNDDDAIINVFKENHGHLIASIEKLSKKVMETSIPFDLTYVSPSTKSISNIVINNERAEKYFRIINDKKELTNEQVIFIGYFVSVDVDKCKWRLRLSEENREILGTDSSNLISGTIIETQLYKVLCQEKITELRISDKEIPEYVLLELEIL